MEYSSEYFLSCIQNLTQIIRGVGGCETIENLFSEGENTIDIKAIKNQGRDK